MADRNPGLIVPQPIYQLNPEIAASLKEEIQREREKSLNLAKQLEIERYKTQQLEEYLKNLSTSSSNLSCFMSRSQENLLPRTESMCSFVSMTDLTPDSKTRACSPNTRRQKIERYKNKIRNYRQRVTFSRSFTGRSKVAKEKPRVNGKFIKVSSFETFSSNNDG
jgi:hypothetical protein